MKSFSKLIFSLAIGSIALSTPAYAEEKASTDKQEVIVYFNDMQSMKQTVFQSSLGDVQKKFQNIPAMVMEVTPDKIDDLENVRTVRNVEFNKEVRLNVEKDSIKQIASISATPSFEWGLSQTNAKDAWSKGNTGTGVKIAIADSGIDMTHADLKYAGGKAFITDTKIDGSTDASIQDYNGHGTHVAGIIGAKNNGIGVTGVAPDSQLYILKVFDKTGISSTVEILSAIEWSIQNDIDILNMSLGTQETYDEYQAVFDASAQQGLIVVAAAGNDYEDALIEGGCAGLESNNCVDYPGAFSSTISVAAMDKDLQHAYFSSAGPSVNVTAPGVDIASTYLNGGYAYMSGTSMATPYVSGIVALYKQTNPTATPAQIKQMVINNAVDLGLEGKDVFFGNGYVQATPEAKTSYNTPPLLRQPINDMTLSLGQSVTADFSSNFTDKDGDSVQYDIYGIEGSSVTVQVQNNKVTLTPQAVGNTTISIGATDGTEWIYDTFMVTVDNNPKAVPTVAFNKNIYFFDKLSLYNNADNTVAPISALSPQTVYAINQKGDWFEIKTWLGNKWIKPAIYVEGTMKDATKRIKLTTRATLYDYPLVGKARAESLNPQTIYSIRENNGWYLIKTWIGYKWIKPDGAVIDEYIEKLTLNERVDIYSSPDNAYKTTSTLNPQTVYVYEKRDEWFRVRTWMGYKWIKPVKYTVEKPVTQNQNVQLTNRVNLYDVPYELTPYGGSIAPQKVYAVEKMGDWYLINTWLGKKWVQII